MKHILVLCLAIGIVSPAPTVKNCLRSCDGASEDDIVNFIFQNRETLCMSSLLRKLENAGLTDCKVEISNSGIFGRGGLLNGFGYFPGFARIFDGFGDYDDSDNYDSFGGFMFGGNRRTYRLYCCIYDFIRKIEEF